MNILRVGSVFTATFLASASLSWSQTSLYKVPGNFGDKNFGSVIEVLGDINGDGKQDFAVAAYASGRIRLISGANGATLWTYEDATPNSWFGYSMSASSDVNGDGYPDLLVGARGGITNASPNKAVVLSGKTGTVIKNLSMSLSNNANYGTAVLALGDVNGDAKPDFAVSAPYSVGHPGEIYVLNGASASVSPLYMLSEDYEMGLWLCTVGDFNQDGRNDFAALSAYGLKIFSGASGSLLYSYSTPIFELYKIAYAGDLDQDGFSELILSYPSQNKISVLSPKKNQILFSASDSGGGFGFAAANVGDFDGDATPDLIVGAPGKMINGSPRGMARVISGKDGATLFSYYGKPNAAYGISVSRGILSNGDSYSDPLVGSQPLQSNGEVVVETGYCGLVDDLGGGCAGAFGFVPMLTIEGCAVPGKTLTFNIVGPSGHQGLLLSGASINDGFSCVAIPQPTLLPFQLPFVMYSVSFTSTFGSGSGTITVGNPNLPTGGATFSLPMTLPFQGISGTRYFQAVILQYPTTLGLDGSSNVVTATIP